jgi:CDGSH-type Zn-finger protein/uncharacterized Fe-S cluster protein YjdI
MLRERVIPYRGKDIVVKFSVDRCTHVSECIMGQPDVFDVRKTPWVNPDAVPADEVAEVILRCPTGSLHYKRLDGGPEEAIPEKNVIRIEENGPYMVSGNVEVKSADGNVLFRDTRIAFCRCGASKHMPFCDNRHNMSDYEDDGLIDSSKLLEDLRDHKNEKLEATLSPNGPILLSGPVEIFGSDGRIGFRGTRCALCRCGATQNGPFCDGSHAKAGFRTE